eukprot:scaffold359890_cov49-Prasinocladus_malaysianus.AAC.1
MHGGVARRSAARVWSQRVCPPRGRIAHSDGEGGGCVRPQRRAGPQGPLGLHDPHPARPEGHAGHADDVADAALRALGFVGSFVCFYHCGLTHTPQEADSRSPGEFQSY